LRCLIPNHRCLCCSGWQRSAAFAHWSPALLCQLCLTCLPKRLGDATVTPLLSLVCLAAAAVSFDVHKTQKDALESLIRLCNGTFFLL
jgi:hypothetical protein